MEGREANNGGVEVQNGFAKGLQIRVALMRNKISVRIKGKRFKRMILIRNPGPRLGHPRKWILKFLCFLFNFVTELIKVDE
jgi:hypothetical protein